MTAKSYNKPAASQRKLSFRLALGLAAPIALLTAGALRGTAASGVSTIGFGENFSQWYKEICCDHSAKVVSSPVRAGKEAVKFTYRKGDGRRAELALPSVPRNSERWYAASIYVPTDFKAVEGSFIITQFHSTEDKGEPGKIPPLFIQTDGKTLSLGSRWDDGRKLTSNSRDVKRQSWDLGSLPKGRWIDFVYHVKWSYQSDGFLEVFMDGKKVAEKTGPNTYNDDKGPYMKIGMYASGINSEPELYNFSEQVLYFDRIRVGDASANYKTVASR
jgi:hypothetical protein